MIPFHKIYGWLFKSFSINEESKFIQKLLNQGYDQMMVVKRSWIFSLQLIPTTLILIGLGLTSIYLGYAHLPKEVPSLRYTIIIGNILMMVVFLVSSYIYLHHFRNIYSNSHEIIKDIPTFVKKLSDGDKYFTNFFNWSITNQWILGLIFILECIFVIINVEHLFHKNNGTNLGIFLIIIDFLVIFGEIHFLRQFRKRMMDMEMDFNIIVHGKIFFVNQSGLLSDIQTIESDKIKTIKSNFPNKIASFFNF